MRILTVSHNWQGANDYSFVRAFRRAGHSVLVVSDQDFVPNGLRSVALRIAGAGHLRAQRSGYSYDDRVAAVLEAVRELRVAEAI